MSYRNPLTRPIHALGWMRPAGNTDFVITRHFGDRSVEVNGAWPAHNGVDIANGRSGDQVVAIGPGQVVYAAEDPMSGDAKIVIVLLDDNRRQWAAHLGSFNVTKGMRVAAGTVLGTVDTTGWATGAHLHHQLQVKALFGWKDIDPEPYLSLVEKQLPSTAVKLAAYVGPGTVTAFRIQGGTLNIVGRKTISTNHASFAGHVVEGVPGYFWVVDPATAPLLHYYLIKGKSGPFTIRNA